MSLAGFAMQVAEKVSKGCQNFNLLLVTPPALGCGTLLSDGMVAFRAPIMVLCVSRTGMQDVAARLASHGCPHGTVRLCLARTDEATGGHQGSIHVNTVSPTDVAQASVLLATYEKVRCIVGFIANECVAVGP